MKTKHFYALAGIVGLGLLAGCSKDLSQQPSSITENASKAPLVNDAIEATYVNNAYIVVFNDDVSDVDAETNKQSKAFGLQVKYRYKHAFKGFAANLSTQAVEALRNNPRVKYIEQDQVMQAVAIQSSATWGIDRVDQANLPLSKTYSYTATGAGVDAYIFDTGIKLDHTEFAGRTRAGYDAFGGSAADANGHGTHVSGTVGGNTYGIAKEVKLVAVRVLDASGSGSTSGVAAGLDWAVGDHTTAPAVGNMSLGGGTSTVIDDAVRRAIADGIVMCVAAGNSNRDASRFSPARVTEAITVGATTSADALASYSNYGPVVDILAPGTGITSSWYTSTTATNTISGTSMATPHVAGVAALYKSINTTATPAAVQTALKTGATPNKISGLPRGTVNALLFSNY